MSNLANWLSNFSIVIQYESLCVKIKCLFALEKPWCYQYSNFLMRFPATKLQTKDSYYLCGCMQNDTEKMDMYMWEFFSFIPASFWFTVFISISFQIFWVAKLWMRLIWVRLIHWCLQYCRFLQLFDFFPL